MRNLMSLVSIAMVMVMLALVRRSASHEPTTLPCDPRRDRVAAAERVVQYLEAREAGGEAITPSFLELKSSWQRRVFEARLEAESTDEGKRQVARRRVVQTRKALERQFSLHGKPPLMQATQAFDLADAECRLAQLGG